jgi:hypothetical protein
MKLSWAAALVTVAIAGQALGQEATEPPKPCASPEHHQFDFWIGSGDVHTADGELAGTNTIQPLFDGCVLQEHWQGVGGSAGTSLNLYREADGKWHQTWVDARAGMLELSGGWKDGKMVLSGKTPSKRGEMLDEITWEPLEDGRVRQHWQRSPDQGKTWNEVFDGYYSRQKEE